MRHRELVANEIDGVYFADSSMWTERLQSVLHVFIHERQRSSIIERCLAAEQHAARLTPRLLGGNDAVLDQPLAVLLDQNILNNALLHGHRRHLLRIVRDRH